MEEPAPKPPTSPYDAQPNFAFYGELHAALHLRLATHTVRPGCGGSGADLLRRLPDALGIRRVEKIMRYQSYTFEKIDPETRVAEYEFRGEAGTARGGYPAKLRTACGTAAV